MHFNYHFDAFLEIRAKTGKGVCHSAIRNFLQNVELSNLADNLPPDKIITRSRNNFLIISASEFPECKSDICIKVTHPDNLLKLLISPFRKSKARRAFEAACHLKANDLDTPEPMGWFDDRVFGFVRNSYYFSEYLPEFIKLKKMVKQNLDQPELIRKLMIKAADYCRNMHNSGFTHRDLNLANFLLIQTEENYHRLVLIDLNRYRLRFKLHPIERIMDISRLYWKKYRLDFFYTYCGNEQRLLKYLTVYNLYYRWRKFLRKIKR